MASGTSPNVIGCSGIITATFYGVVIFADGTRLVASTVCLLVDGGPYDAVSSCARRAAAGLIRSGRAVVGRGLGITFSMLLARIVLVGRRPAVRLGRRIACFLETGIKYS